MSTKTNNKTANAAKVGISTEDTYKGAFLEWNYGDLNGEVREVENVAIATTKSGNKCFELQIEGRDKSVKVMPANALVMGIADVEDDLVVVTATKIKFTTADGRTNMQAV